MSVTGDEPLPPPVEVVSITAKGESDEGRKVGLNVQLANAPNFRGEDEWVHRALTRRIMAALGLRQIGAGPDGVVQVQVLRDGIEQAVGAIHRAVREFNEAYPFLPAEHRREVEHKTAVEAAETERLQADQVVIDRAMKAEGGQTPSHG